MEQHRHLVPRMDEYTLYSLKSPLQDGKLPSTTLCTNKQCGKVCKIIENIKSSYCLRKKIFIMETCFHRRFIFGFAYCQSFYSHAPNIYSCHKCSQISNSAFGFYSVNSASWWQRCTTWNNEVFVLRLVAKQQTTNQKLNNASVPHKQENQDVATLKNGSVESRGKTNKCAWERGGKYTTPRRIHGWSTTQKTLKTDSA